jgi:hypothetical protein
MGKGGKLNMNIDYVRMPDGDKLALPSVQELKGGGHGGAMTGGMVATAIVSWPAVPLWIRLSSSPEQAARSAGRLLKHSWRPVSDL